MSISRKLMFRNAQFNEKRKEYCVLAFSFSQNMSVQLFPPPAAPVSLDNNEIETQLLLQRPAVIEIVYSVRSFLFYDERGVVYHSTVEQWQQYQFDAIKETIAACLLYIKVGSYFFDRTQIKQWSLDHGIDGNYAVRFKAGSGLYEISAVEAIDLFYWKVLYSAPFGQWNDWYQEGEVAPVDPEEAASVDSEEEEME